MRSDPYGDEQLRVMRFDQPGQRLLQLLGVRTEPLGQRAQGEPRSPQYRIRLPAAVADQRTGADERSSLHADQFFPQHWIGSDQDCFELVGGLGAGFDSRALGHRVHACDLYRAVP
ncbi:hypothetical protein AB0I84_45505 [Streptomyces spectabilis]|uniref:hypothetical protein n=1 Tax=Streptomyces spectabilis TaxID=68270 RepID=UPI0033F5A4FC